ncbi:MAG: hypothetical protein R3F49_07510 [Planctomycetota bacterium]
MTSTAVAQTTLVANTSNNNGLTAGTPGLFFDFTASANDLTITELSTASNRAPNDVFDLEVLTYVGSCLGGPASGGPGSSAVGWTSLGVVTATQGAVQNGTSLPIDIPDIFVPAGQTVGVVLIYLTGGARYFGTGTTPPSVFTDGELTLTSGDARSAPFTGAGTWFQSRGLHGEVTYVVGFGGGVGSTYCAPAVANSTGAGGTLRASGQRAAAANDVTVVAGALPMNSFGFFLASMTQGSVGQPGGSQGTLCLGGAIGRYVGPGQIQNSGATGSFSLALDLTQTPTPNGLVSVNAGETWNFQAWYRDSVGGVATSNFTEGLSIDFL